MIAGIILAGGKASRIGKNKMILEYKSKPLIFHTVTTMLEICNIVTIVTGNYKEDYLKYFSDTSRLRIIDNKNFEKGMFSSVLTGVNDVESDFFLIPGDYPLVKVETYQNLMNNEELISVPTYKGRKGHPIFIRKECLLSLKQESIDSNLKVFRDKHIVKYVEVDDPGVIFDIDNNDDYVNLLRYERNE